MSDLEAAQVLIELSYTVDPERKRACLIGACALLYKSLEERYPKK